jgi:hypothetical protein
MMAADVFAGRGAVRSALLCWEGPLLLLLLLLLLG